MFVVYVLKSLRDGNLYTGVTSNIDRRLKEHNAGQTKSLKSRRPLILVYQEVFPSRRDALARERYFKTPEGGVLKQQLVEHALASG